MSGDSFSDIQNDFFKLVSQMRDNNTNASKQKIPPNPPVQNEPKNIIRRKRSSISLQASAQSTSESTENINRKLEGKISSLQAENERLFNLLSLKQSQFNNETKKIKDELDLYRSNQSATLEEKLVDAKNKITSLKD
jgi:hypothetical protein